MKTFEYFAEPCDSETKPTGGNQKKGGKSPRLQSDAFERVAFHLVNLPHQKPHAGGVRHGPEAVSVHGIVLAVNYSCMRVGFFI